MKQAIEKSWKLLKDITEAVQQNTEGIVFDKTKEKEFDSYFREQVNYIRTKYMKDDKKDLDRHKIASIIIVSAIKAKVIRYEGKLKEADEEFFGQYLIAVSAGISYLQDRLNDKLIDKGQRTIDKIYMPEALSCDTPYFEIMCRNLYYAENHEGWGINPLEIAEKFFLLEYFTLEKNGIDPKILKDKD